MLLQGCVTTIDKQGKEKEQIEVPTEAVMGIVVGVAACPVCIAFTAMEMINFLFCEEEGEYCPEKYKKLKGIESKPIQ
jgi:hypothetical protein